MPKSLEVLLPYSFKIKTQNPTKEQAREAIKNCIGQFILLSDKSMGSQYFLGMVELIGGDTERYAFWTVADTKKQKDLFYRDLKGLMVPANEFPPIKIKKTT